VFKFTVSKTESRRIRATTKQIGGGSGGVNSHSLENRCELHEETERRVKLTCEFSSFSKGIIARIWKAVKNFLLWLLILIVLCQASPSTQPSPIRLHLISERQAGEGESFTVPLKIGAPGLALIFRPCQPRHGQTPARCLHLPESEPPWQAGRGFVVRDDGACF